ncbi:hypothetical protein GETHOR_08210 [Geothrix oryzae]|uniref:Uncharacterized protein n=1 Tax=Geothrix oryzae TaxID=2927975 RepID=A0ABN6V2I9_9BACT|nr:DEAD/DEAH box helicase [Geothrix oryzae]BDU68720.1 hypothetical protein GETHOR_08210 [Geothrix oryzae]
MGLYPFQSEGVRNLVTRRCILLADEMGLGKTVQTVIALEQLFQQGAIRRVLIVCPSSLCINWKNEIAKWGTFPAVIYQGSDRFGMLEGHAPVLIGSLETITSDLQRPTWHGEGFFDIGIDVLVIDEAQRIKAPEGIRSKVLSKLVAPRRWAITGTPLENHPRELASILRFLAPNEFLTANDLNDAEKILFQTDQLMLRRTKSEVGLQLPEKVVARIGIALTPEQGSEYALARMNLLNSLQEARSVASATICILQGLQELRRIAVISSDGASSKFDLIEEEMEEIAARGEKAVIFSSFANIALPHIASRLVKYGALLYTGSMTREQREHAHEQFLNDPKCKVMCASLRAAGVGLTWTVASHVYHTDNWWNPQILNQADDRVHRIGQRKPVFIKRLIAEGTVEDAIEDLLSAKEDLFSYVVDDRQMKPTDSPKFSTLLSLVGGVPSDFHFRS